MKTPILALLALIVMTLFVALTGCTATISADGSKSATVDGEQFLRAIAIIAEK